MRVAAAEPASPEAIAEVTKQVDGPVAIAWVNEIGQQFEVDAKQLTTLANAGVSPDVIDMMVALSYPDKFTVRRNDGTDRGTGAAVAPTTEERPRASASRRSDWDCGYGSRMLMYGYYGDSCMPGYGMDLYGYRYGYGYDGFGYGYPYGYYYGQQPIVIIPGDGGSGSPIVRGRAVKGKGYTRGSGSNGQSNPSGSQRTDKASSGSGSGSATPAPKPSTTGGSTGRTARPRTPPPPPSHR
jgi:hypothetical protein